MTRLHCYLLALAVAVLGGGADPGRAETDSPQTLIESPFLYLANAVFLHHASAPDSVDLIHLVTPTIGADMGNQAVYASRFSSSGRRLIETKIAFGPTCGAAVVCWPLSAFIRR
jgi:hypothetical protein